MSEENKTIELEDKKIERVNGGGKFTPGTELVEYCEQCGYIFREFISDGSVLGDGHEFCTKCNKNKRTRISSKEHYAEKAIRRKWTTENHGFLEENVLQLITGGENLDYDEVARRCIKGFYGEGEAMKRRLIAEGYEYELVLEAIEKILHPEE